MVLRIVSQFWLNQGQHSAQARAVAPTKCCRGCQRPARAAPRAAAISPSSGSHSSTRPVGRVRNTAASPAPASSDHSQSRRGPGCRPRQRRWLSSHQLPVSTAVRLRSIR